MSSDTDDDGQHTRPISVAELLARNGTIGAPPVGGRRRRRRGNTAAVTVAELTGEIPVIRDEPPLAEKVVEVEPAEPEVSDAAGGAAPEAGADVGQPEGQPKGMDTPSVSESDSERDSSADGAESEPEPESGSGLESGGESDLESDLKSEAASDAESDAGSDLGPGLDSDAEPDTEREAGQAGEDEPDSATDALPEQEPTAPAPPGSSGTVAIESVVEPSAVRPSGSALPRSSDPRPRRSGGPERSYDPRPQRRPSGAEQMSFDPVDETVDIADLVGDQDVEEEKLRSYLTSSGGALFSGETVADDLARRGIGGESASQVAVVAPAPPKRSGGRLAALRRALIAVVQSVLSVAFGAGLFVAFDQLWRWNTLVALVLSVLVILGLVIAVRVVRRTEDIASTLIAVAVGALVTLGPLALLQSYG